MATPAGNMGIKKKDLGGYHGMEAASAVRTDKDRGEEVHYPSFTLSDKHIEAAGLDNVMPDDVIEFTVKARVQSVQKKSKSKSPSYDSDRVELEVQDISDVTAIDAQEPEESDDEKTASKSLGFSAKAVKPSGGGAIGPRAAGIKAV